MTKESVLIEFEEMAVKITDFDDLSLQEKKEFYHYLFRLLTDIPTLVKDSDNLTEKILQDLNVLINDDKSTELYDTFVKNFDVYKRALEKLPEDIFCNSESKNQLSLNAPENTDNSEKKNSSCSSRNDVEKHDEAKVLAEDFIDKDIFQDYILEMNVYLEDLEESVLTLEKDLSNEELIKSVFRILHGIKGNSGVMKHLRLHKIAHATEDILDDAKNNRKKLSEKSMNLIFKSIDFIKKTVLKFNPDDVTFESVDEKEYEKLLNDLRIFDETSEPILSAEVSENTETDSEEYAQTEKFESLISKIENTSNEISEITDPPDIESKDKNNKVLDKTEFARIATHKLDSLINMLGELIITANSLKQDKVVTDKRNFELNKKVSNLSRVVSELQETGLALRMVPIGNTFQKIKRLVRDYSQKHNKRIALVIKGADAEIDRNIVDLLYEPMAHLVRNACDHGIESEKERTACGKNPEGNITLDAYHKGNSFIIDVIDDGKGIDKEKIRSKAIERGIIKKDEILSEFQIHNILVNSGISTATEVTAISGRGVGMNAVMQSLKNLGGVIEIESKNGRGSTFRIKLPITLGIIQGMLVKSQGSLFVVPIVSIVRTLRPKKENINKMTGKYETIKIDEKIIPVVRLNEALGIEGNEEQLDKMILMLINSSEGYFALAVDELLSIQDVVIKTLGDKFKQLKSISGATILGDGKMGLILDMNYLFKRNV